MKNSKIVKFLIGLAIDIGISLILDLGLTLTIVFALLYIIIYGMYYTSDIKAFLKSYRDR